MTMTEKKHAIKPYPLGAHVEDGAIRFAYASGKKDCGILIYDRKSGKKTHRVPFRQEERMGNVYCKYLELEPGNVGYQFYDCLLYTSPSPRDRTRSRMPSSA